MTHVESLVTKIMIINYTALCKIQLVLKQTTTVQPTPPPFPEPPKRRKNHCETVTGRVLLIQTTKQKSVGDRCLWCEGRDRRAGKPVLLPSAPRIHGQCQLPPNAQVWLDGWMGRIDTLVTLFSSSGPYSSLTQLSLEFMPVCACLRDFGSCWVSPSSQQTELNIRGPSSGTN